MGTPADRSRRDPWVQLLPALGLIAGAAVATLLATAGTLSGEVTALLIAAGAGIGLVLGGLVQLRRVRAHRHADDGPEPPDR